LDALAVGIRRERVNWVLDMDFRDYFSSLDHLSMAICFSPTTAREFPTGGHQISPLVATKSPHWSLVATSFPHWWPPDLPTRGGGVRSGVRSGASLPCRRSLGRACSCRGRR
jgi:hypothetical protein